MDTLTLFVLALGLAMDATAVAAARGLTAQRVGPKQVLLVALWFGGAQGLMPVLGAALGGLVGPSLAAYNQWIGALVLWAIGGKMLLDAFRNSEDEGEAAEADPFAPRIMFLLALATSLDAFAVGVTLPLLKAPIVLAALVIGCVTAVASGLGLLVGSRFGALFGKRLDIAGGAVLLLLGVRVLLGP